MRAWTLASAALALGAGLAASPARAVPIEGVADDFAAACKAPEDPRLVQAATGGGNLGVIPAKKVRAALLKAFALDAGLLLDEGPAGLARRARTAQRAAPGDEGKLAQLNGLVAGWRAVRKAGYEDALPLADGGLVIATRPGQEPRLSDMDGLLADIFAGRDGTFVFICKLPPDAGTAAPKPPAPTPPGPPPPPPPKFVLVKNAADLGEADLSKKTFGEFSFNDDREKRAQAYGITFAGGWTFPERQWIFGDDKLHGPRLTRRMTLYSAYERKGSNDRKADNYVNNLNFGPQLSGDLEFRPQGSTWLGYYALTGSYQTDDDFASRAYTVEGRLDVPLPVLPAHRVFYKLGAPSGIDADALWSLEAVADWVQVDDPGEKKALIDKKEFARIGYDAGLKVRVGPADQDWRIVWATLYQLRDGQTEDGGDAQMLSSSVSFALSKATHYSFGLAYERGENLQSFARSELWKLVIGLRY